MIELKEEHNYELRKISSVPIQNEVLTLTSEHTSSTDQFDRKFQAKISPSEQIPEKPEEEVTPLTKFDREKLHSDFDKYCSEIKATNEHIAAMLAKIMINLTRKLKISYVLWQTKSQRFHPNRFKTFKMKCLLSPLNIHLLKITLRENPNTIFLHIIKALNNQNNN